VKKVQADKSTQSTESTATFFLDFFFSPLSSPGEGGAAAQIGTNSGPTENLSEMAVDLSMNMGHSDAKSGESRRILAYRALLIDLTPGASDKIVEWQQGSFESGG